MHTITLSGKINRIFAGAGIQFKNTASRRNMRQQMIPYPVGIILKDRVK